MRARYSCSWPNVASDMGRHRIAILALQGAFAEHQQMLSRLGVESVLIRNLEDWQAYVDCGLEGEDIACGSHEGKGLILPGGESTAMMKIMHDECLLVPITQAIKEGLPVLGTCAGMILLDDQHLGCMDITVRRNAYGRQLGSFMTIHEVKGLGPTPLVFIRAPYIERLGPDVELLSELDGHPVAARQGKMLACSFHPELTDDTRMHEFFMGLVEE